MDVNEYFACVSENASYVCLVPIEVRGEYQTPYN